MASLSILNPVAPSRVDDRPLAARPSDLAGKRVALLDNQKANAGRLLETVGAELVRRHPGMEITVEHKIATSPSPADVMERAQSCDAVILAIAD